MKSGKGEKDQTFKRRNWAKYRSEKEGMRQVYYTLYRKLKKDKEGILAATLWFPLPRTI
jgi:hypothetical protein